MSDLSRAFDDTEVADLYRFRATYPAETFEIVRGLIAEPRTVLDAGCGRGEFARALVTDAVRVDAVDPSAAMIAIGKRLPHGDDPRLRWILGRAEDAPFSPPYGLITCAASLHWMDASVVLPRFRGALAPGAWMVVAETDARRPVGPLGDELADLIRRYSPNFRATKQVLRELIASGAFMVENVVHTSATPLTQSVEDYLKELSSTAALSRVTLGSRYETFEREFSALFARNGATSVERSLAAEIAWGRPA